MIVRPFIAGSVAAALLIGGLPLTAMADDRSAPAASARPATIRTASVRIAANYRAEVSSARAAKGGSNQTSAKSSEHWFGKRWLWWTLIGAGAGFATGYFVKEGRNHQAGSREDQDNGQNSNAQQ